MNPPGPMANPASYFMRGAQKPHKTIRNGPGGDPGARGVVEGPAIQNRLHLSLSGGFEIILHDVE